MKTFIIIASLLSLGVIVNAGKGNYFKSSKNKTYYIEEQYSYTWFEAFLECSVRRMYLLTVESEEKLNEIYELLTSGKFEHKPPHVWIGAIGNNRQFSWISTGKPVISTFWTPDNPDNYNNEENCVLLQENTNRFNDRKCDYQFGYVCEMVDLKCNE